MFSALKKLKKSLDHSRPLIEVLVYRDNILHNLKAYQTAYPKLRFAPVLKSNAYGHGLVEVAEILDSQGLPFFMVDSLFEARALRHQGIKTPILVLGFTTADSIAGQKLKDISFAVISLDQLKMVNKALKRKTTIHLKIDTGFRRQGLLPDELREAILIIKKNPKLILEGICSHLPDADGTDKNFTNRQIGLWNHLVEEIEKQAGPLRYKHLANTIGTAFSKNINANIARLGMGLYGIVPSAPVGADIIRPQDGKIISSPTENRLDLKSALQMESVISSIRTLKTGESIGYNLTFTASRDLKVATVPAGYTEGVDRRLSNIGCFLISGVACPIVGRVSMNITSVDVTNVPNAHLEQKVVIVSKNATDPNSIENIAKLCNTITHDIPVRIPSYLKRIVI